MIAIENNTRKKVVFKYPAAGQEASMLIESDALQRVQHPRIVTLLGIARANNTNKKSALILEYAEEGDLMSFLQEKAVSGKERLPESAARTLVLQLLKALDYCAQQRVHHRDVKPENIFLDHNYWYALLSLLFATVAALFLLLLLPVFLGLLVLFSFCVLFCFVLFPYKYF